MSSKHRATWVALGLTAAIVIVEVAGGRGLSNVSLSRVSLGTVPGFLSATAAQQAGAKIGYVNTQALMAAAPGRAAAESLLSKESQTLQTQSQKMQDSINGLLAKYQKEEPTLTAAVKDKRQKDLQALETEFQGKQVQLQQQWQARQSEVMAPITDLVKKVIDDIREEGGYAIIFANDPQASPIVAADKNLDITDKVVSRLRATPAAKINAAPKGAPTSPAGVTARPKPPTQ